MRVMQCVCLAFTLFAVQSPFAQNKVYDQTGAFKFTGGHADFHASSEVDGQTYSTYCYTTTSSVECHEGVDGSYVVQTEDGKELFLSLKYRTGAGLLGVRNPLLDLAIAHSGEEVRIRFRLIERCSTLKYGNPCTFSDHRTMLCIPYGGGAGKSLKEACYAITLISPATNAARGPRLPETANPAIATAVPESSHATSQDLKGTVSSSVVANSENAKSSPAAAVAMANAGHVQTPLELAHLVQIGRASRCAVVTTPPGAEVLVDCNKLGVSPVVFVLLRNGEDPRTVTVRLQGFKTVEKKFVPDGKTIPIALQLERDTP